MELGADTLEMDVQVTRDGHPVTIHDATVDATTDGTGRVDELTLAQLRELDAGHDWRAGDGSTPFRGRGLTHPSLREVMEAFPETYLVVELKTDGGRSVIQPVIDLVREHGREQRTAIVSFDQTYLVPVREQLPQAATNMPESETRAFYVRQLLGLHPWWQPPGRLYQVPETFDGRRVVTPRFTRAAERLGVDVHVWTVNEREQMHRVLEAGARGLITDFPERAREVITEREARAREDPGDRGTDLERIVRLQDRVSWLTPVLRAVTLLGDEEFYLVLLPVLYWAVDRRLGRRVGVLLLISAGLNHLLKLWFVAPRPGFLRPGVALVEEASLGLPSGHAQNGAAIWGLLATVARRRWLRVALVVLVALLGWSRIHLGAHFPEDVVVGWAIGALLLGAFVALQGRVGAWWSRLPTVERVLASLAAGLALAAPALLLAGRLRHVDPGWPGLLDPAAVTGAGEVVAPAAALAGFGIGVAALARSGGFDHRGPVGRRLLRVLVGLVGVVALAEGLGALLPSGDDAAALAATALRYTLVGAWVGGLAPWMFVRAGLATPAAGESAADSASVADYRARPAHEEQQG